jgi:hypothetical protein
MLFYQLFISIFVHILFNNYLVFFHFFSYIDKRFPIDYKKRTYAECFQLSRLPSLHC